MDIQGSSPDRAFESQQPSASQTGHRNDEGRERFRIWVNKLSEECAETVLARLLVAGCDIWFLARLTYLYCSPDPDPAKKASLLIESLPNCIRDARKLLKRLKCLETPEHLDLLGIDPEASRLERYVEHLEAALKKLKLTHVRGSFRPFYLLCMSYYLRAAYPEQWRGRSLRKAVNADIRDLVNAGFIAHEISEVITEDQVRHQCERFIKRYPAFARNAQKQAKNRPSEMANLYEVGFQYGVRWTPDNSPD